MVTGIPRATGAALLCVGLGPLLAPAGSDSARVLSAAAPPSQSQAVADPPAPVELPDLTRLEPAIAEQLRAHHERLRATIAAPVSGPEERAEAYGVLGQLYHVYEFDAQAQACYARAAGLAPDDYRWHYLRGHLLAAGGQLEAGLAAFQAALDCNESYTAAALRGGAVCLQLGRLADARRYYAVSDARSAAAQYGLGRVALAEKDFARAVRHFESALRLEPGANRVHYVLGMALRGLGQTEQAATHLARRGPIAPSIDDPLVESMQAQIEGERVHIIRGKSALSAGRPERAVEAFQKALEANPASRDAHIELGVAHLRLGHRDKAVEHFRAAQRLDPQSTVASFNLGVLLREEGDFDGAAAQFEAVLRRDPTDTQSLRQRALVLADAGRHAQAVHTLYQAVALEPEDEGLMLDLVGVLEREGRYLEARAILERGHRQFPQRLRTAVALARLLAACPLERVRDGGRAAMLARAACRRAETPGHQEVLAMALAESGYFRQAVTIQKNLHTMATRQGLADVARRLEAVLRQYEEGRPFRLGGERDSEDAPAAEERPSEASSPKKTTPVRDKLEADSERPDGGRECGAG